MASESLYLRAIIPSLPTEIAQKIRSLCSTTANEVMLENLVRFLTGGGCATDASKSIQEQWFEKQIAAKKIISALLPSNGNADKKRPREDEVAEDLQQSKKQRVSPAPKGPNGVTSSGAATLSEAKPLYTLHALSATSPVRKKVDITISSTSITMANPTSHAAEATIPLASIKRAFIIPTRGKQKPHWTVILLTSDVPDKGKASDNQQIIFGVDAAPTAPFTTTSYIDGAEPVATVSPKCTETLPFLHAFLTHLNAPRIEPSPAVFRSVCASTGKSASAGGVPGVEAYRAAKAGNLWFAREGVLWGESKPCEFWAVEDLLNRAEGVRVSGSGRTCTVVLTRRGSATGEMAEGEEDMGEETEFGMIDAKEREGINEWVRSHRHLFGRTPGAPAEENDTADVKVKVANSGPVTIRTLLEGSDSEDDDFSASVSDLDGSEQSTDGDSDDDDEGNGNDEDAEGEDDAGENDDEEEEGSENDEEEELDPAHHPLLRPGAMPKMSKAALEMAVGIVESQLVGGAVDGDDELDDDDQDELDD